MQAKRPLRSNTQISSFPQQPNIKRARKQKSNMDAEFKNLPENERSLMLYKLMTSTNEKIDKFEKRMDTIQANQTQLTYRIAALETNVEAINKKPDLDDARIKELQQQNLENEFTILGLPKISKDDLPQIIANLNKELNLTIDQKNDIKKLQLQKDSKDNSKTILKCKVFNQHTKMQVINSYRNMIKASTPLLVEKVVPKSSQIQTEIAES